MGELGAFLKISRVPAPERDPRARVHDYGEIFEVLPEAEAARQGARCMECGVPFCHDGCPLGNLDASGRRALPWFSYVLLSENSGASRRPT